jgi:hypothetical protein
MKRKPLAKDSHRLWCIGRYKLAAAHQLVKAMPGISPQNVLAVHLLNDDYLNDMIPFDNFPWPISRSTITVLGMTAPFINARKS